MTRLCAAFGCSSPALETKDFCAGCVAGFSPRQGVTMMKLDVSAQALEQLTSMRASVDRSDAARKEVADRLDEMQKKLVILDRVFEEGMKTKEVSEGVRKFARDLFTNQWAEVMHAPVVYKVDVEFAEVECEVSAVITGEDVKRLQQDYVVAVKKEDFKRQLYDAHRSGQQDVLKSLKHRLDTEGMEGARLFLIRELDLREKAKKG